MLENNYVIPTTESMHESFEEEKLAKRRKRIDYSFDVVRSVLVEFIGDIIFVYIGLSPLFVTFLSSVAFPASNEAFFTMLSSLTDMLPFMNHFIQWKIPPLHLFKCIQQAYSRVVFMTPFMLSQKAFFITCLMRENLDIIENNKKMGKDSMKWIDLIRAVVVEFIGDVLFVYIGSLSATAGGTTGVLPAAFAHGFCIFLLVASMGHISGGHYNPAVTLGVFISGNLGVLPTILYWIAQLLGGTIGSFLVKATAPNATDYEKVAGLTLPNTQYGISTMIICEAVLTYILVSTVLNAAVDKAGNNPVAPLAIGCAVLVDIIAGGHVSGASMNPARSLGPSVVYSIFGAHKATAWNYHYIYWAGPIIGATVAGLIYKSNGPSTYKKRFANGHSERIPNFIVTDTQIFASLLAEKSSRWISRGPRHTSGVAPISDDGAIDMKM